MGCQGRRIGLVSNGAPFETHHVRCDEHDCEHARGRRFVRDILSTIAILAVFRAEHDASFLPVFGLLVLGRPVVEGLAAFGAYHPLTSAKAAL